MRILNIRTISGPNVYHHRPVLVMTLDLEDLAETASSDLPGFSERLVKALPGLEQHRCSPGRPGGFLERLGRGTYFAHIIEHIALELSDPAGISVGYGKSIYGDASGIYKVVIRYQSEEGMKEVLKTAVELAQAVAKGEEFDIQNRLVHIREVVQDYKLGPSTQAIVDAAERRSIPWFRLNDQNLIQFGYGKHRRIIQATTTNLTSDIAVDIAQDKDLTKKLLEQASIRVPRGVIVYSAEEAVEAFIELGVSVAIKPLDGHHGKGVSLGLSTREAVTEAFNLASRYCSAVLVEELFVGRDFRILVVGGKVVAAAERVPAHVVGDGISTISQLIDRENENPLRGEGHEKPMTKISIDEVAEAYLRRQQITLDSVPAAGQAVYIRETANLSTGGRAVDVTERLHPETRLACERAARIIGLDICGIDLMVADIEKPMSGQRGGVIEVNAGPGIRMHHYPSEGMARDVGAAIVEQLYPGNSTSRIPIVSITGTNGKTTVTRLIGHVLSEAGTVTGITTSDGIYVCNERVAAGDTTGPISARAILCDPGIEAAVLETARGGILRRGLGYDWSDVGVITNIQPDHFGQDGIEDLDDILRIKSLVAERVKEGGTLVLNADDPLLAQLHERPSVAKLQRKFVYFSLIADQDVLNRHLAAGGTGYFVKDGWFNESQNEVVSRICRVDEIPITFGGTARFQLANVMAALGACRALGLSFEVIVKAMKKFEPNRNNSGRTNVYRVQGPRGVGYVMVDYGHNPEAFRAICEMTSSWHRKVTGVIAVPGDRSDDMIRMSGTVAANGFDRVLIREDLDTRGRESGNAAKLLCETIHQANPGQSCTIELDERSAFEKAIREMGKGEVVVLFYDDLALVHEVLNRHSAVPLQDFSEITLDPDLSQRKAS